jgi:hypothetical protein
MHTHPRCTVGPDDVTTPSRALCDARDDVLAFALEDSVEDHLAATLALVLAAVALRLHLARPPTRIEWSIRGLERAARERHG